MENKKFLTVGELSKIGNISPRVLRHYDKIGLLKPEKINQRTGYRYYAMRQIFSLSLIEDLKKLGFSLTEIKKIFYNRSIENIIILYQKKKQEIEKQISNLNLIKENIDFRLDIFEKIDFWENFVDTSDVFLEVKKIRERSYLGIEKRIDFTFENLALMTKEIQTMANKNKINLTGPFFICFYENYENKKDVFLEVGCFVKEEYENFCKKLPAGIFLSGIARGKHEKTIPLYYKMKQWIENHQYRINGPILKIYWKSFAFTNDLDKLLTEIQIPIVK